LAATGARGVQGLRERALEEDAIERYEKLHPEKARKPRPRGGGAGGFPDMAAPDGMDPAEWARMMAQMRGDFSHEKDPEKRKILSKLKASGMSFAGGSDMDIEQLRNLEKLLDDLPKGGFGGMPDDMPPPKPSDGADGEMPGDSGIPSHDDL